MVCPETGKRRRSGQQAIRARLGVWALVVVAVVLATRTIVYALAPQSVLLAALAHGEGGPNLGGALIAAVLVGAGTSIAVLWLAVAAVRERLALEGRRLVETPRLRLGRLGVRALALFLAASFAFAMTESYIHWRAGLGWHGLHCLTGPVHRDAIPILVALSLVAVALHGAIEHLLEWARRLIVHLASRLPRLSGTAPVAAALAPPRHRLVRTGSGARGPPGPVFVSAIGTSL